jgi:putative ABC transport system permease protein
METIRRDVTFALRSLAKRPAFTLLVVVTLTLGIGASTAIFSIVNALLLRPLPFDAPERLAALYERDLGGGETRVSVAVGNFLDWQQNSSSFEHMTAYSTRTATVTADASDAEAERVEMCNCSGNVFATTRVTLVMGRPFRPEDDRFGTPGAVVISFDLWQRLFGGAADIVGRPIRIDNTSYEVIGVAPRGFVFPNRFVQIWSPLLTTVPPQMQMRHDLHNLSVVGRLRADASFEQAQSEINAISARYKAAHPQEATGAGATVVPLHAELIADARKPLTVLFAAVVCVLFIACLNIANLMLTRAATRTREFGIRRALGATRRQVVQQLITESVLLALAGAAGGVVLAAWLAKLLAIPAPGADAILAGDDGLVDLSVLLFALAIALGAGVAIGIVPALRSSRASGADMKSTSRGDSDSPRSRRFRNVVMAVEVALSVVLLTVAALLVQSFSRLYQVRPGVRVDNVLTVATLLPGPAYQTQARRSAVLGQLGDRLRAVPGVESAGLVSCPPLTGSCNVLFFYIEGRPYVSGKFFAALERSADPGYFRAAGIPLVGGRTFTAQDGVGFDPAKPRPGSIVISESMARMFFPGEDPIGKRIFFDFEMQRERNEGLPAPRYEIIGVVGDVRPTLQDAAVPTLYRPLLDIAYRGVTAVIHTRGEPRSVIGAVREEIRRLDPGLLVFQFRTIDELMGQSTSERRFNTMLVGAFATLALLLAAIGLYGVVSFAVAQRTSEIGLRMALGATNTTVGRMIVMQGLKPALAGTLLGLAAAALSTRIVRSLLFDITTTDPLTFAVVPLVLLTVAALACYLPARRASRLDPTLALRVIH